MTIRVKIESFIALYLAFKCTQMAISIFVHYDSQARKWFKNGGQLFQAMISSQCPIFVAKKRCINRRLVLNLSDFVPKSKTRK